MTVFRDKKLYLGKFDKIFLPLSLYFRYENQGKRQYYPVGSKHYNAFIDSAAFRIDIYNILQADRRIQRPPDGGLFVCIQCNHTVLHSSGIHFHHPGMAVPDREIQGNIP